MKDKKKIFKDTLNLLKKKRIWKFDGYCHIEKPILVIYTGEPSLNFRKCDERNKFDREYIKAFKKIHKNKQTYYRANLLSDYAITLCGNWEIKYNDEILLKTKIKPRFNDNHFFLERLHFLFSGYKVADIKLLDDHIKIDFSNKLSLYLYHYLIDNTDACVLIESDKKKDYFIGLSIEEGIITNTRKYIENKI